MKLNLKHTKPKSLELLPVDPIVEPRRREHHIKTGLLYYVGFAGDPQSTVAVPGGWDQYRWAFKATYTSFDVNTEDEVTVTVYGFTDTTDMPFNVQDLSSMRCYLDRIHVNTPAAPHRTQPAFRVIQSFEADDVIGVLSPTSLQAYLSFWDTIGRVSVNDIEENPTLLNATVHDQQPFWATDLSIGDPYSLEAYFMSGFHEAQQDLDAISLDDRLEGRDFDLLAELIDTHRGISSINLKDLEWSGTFEDIWVRGYTQWDALPHDFPLPEHPSLTRHRAQLAADIPPLLQRFQLESLTFTVFGLTLIDGYQWRHDPAVAKMTPADRNVIEAELDTLLSPLVSELFITNRFQVSLNLLGNSVIQVITRDYSIYQLDIPTWASSLFAPERIDKMGDMTALIAHAQETLDL